ncbi:GTP cyclohydrolase II RibA, partial [uncultured Helicobacter sp.]
MNFEISQKAKLPTKYGNFWIQSFKEYPQEIDSHTNFSQSPKEHLVVFTQHLGKIPLVRLHSECLTGDVFGSLKCDCGEELAHSMRAIYANKEGGMLLYLRQEGRGIGLFNKVNAYALQDKGLDTIEANLKLGLPSDCRNYEIVGAIFKSFGIEEIELLTNNPLKVDSLAQYAKVSR